MAVRKLALISETLAAIGVASFVGLGAASAESATGQDTLVSKIAQKFNLNKDDVQKVFDEERATRQAERKAELKATLDKAVADGKITADQAAKLTAKLDEMQTNRPDFKNMTEAEREAARSTMDTKRAEFDAWLKANNIPADLLPMGGPKGPGGRGGHGDSQATTNS